MHMEFVISEVRHEDQLFASSSTLRLDADNRHVEHVELLIMSLWNNHWDSMS
jgi:hypothetical protein